MTSAADDFEALFDEVAAQRSDTVAMQAPAAIEEPTPVQAAESAPTPTAESAADASASQAEKPMFERLGGIVRLLHDSLRELGYDRALTEASSQINDAQDRLEYVATLTEQAANKVLNTLDEGMPDQDKLSKQAKDMSEPLGCAVLGQARAWMNSRPWPATRASSPGRLRIATEAEKARLLEIMMAQDFQDITGQLIKKVVSDHQDGRKRAGPAAARQRATGDVRQAGRKRGRRRRR